jgi:hypothetical protein
MSLQQAFIAMFIPSANPSVNTGAIHLQRLRDLAGSPLLDTEHDGLKAQSDTGGLVGLGGLAEGLEPLEGAWIAARKDRLHRQKGMLFYFYAPKGDPGSALSGKQKGPLPAAKPF